MQLLREYLANAPEAEHKTPCAVQRDAGSVNGEANRTLGGGNGVQRCHRLAAVEVENARARALKGSTLRAEQCAVDLCRRFEPFDERRNGKRLAASQIFALKGRKGQQHMPGEPIGERPAFQPRHTVWDCDAAACTKLLDRPELPPVATENMVGFRHENTSFLLQSMQISRRR